MSASGRVLREWRNRVGAEYTSAGLFAQIVHWTIQATLPEEIIRTGHRIVSAELEHARLSHDVLVALGGVDEPRVVRPDAMAYPPSAGILADLLDSVVINSCFGETLAVPLFQAMAESTTHPVAAAALEQIICDEAVHSAFGYRALDTLIELDAEGVRRRVESSLPSVIDSFLSAYASAPPGRPLTDEERSMGLLDTERYRTITRETIDVDIRRRLAKRGITMGAAALG